MNIDTNSPCPGGRNKPVRQCCPHLTKELDQLNATISGGQFAAGLNYVDGLLKSNPDCACLKAAKCELLRQAGKVEEFLQLAQDFVKAEPENARAYSFLASAELMNTEAENAIKTIVKAIELSAEGHMSTDQVLPMLELSTALVQAGMYFAAIPYMEILEQLEPASKHIQALRYRCNMCDNVPYALREYVFPVETPDGFPKPEVYAKAVSSAVQIRWNTALELFESLLPFADEFPDIYRAIAIIHFWFLDSQKGCEALLKYVQSPKVSQDDRVDAWMICSDQTAMLWGDAQNILSVECRLNDENVAMENLLSSKQLIANDVPRWNDQSGPRPRKIFHLIDRPLPEKKDNYTMSEIPRVLGSFLFFGRTTDHGARLIVPEIMESDIDKASEIIKSVLGASFETLVDPVVVGHCSWTLNSQHYTGIAQGLSPQTSKAFEQEYLLEEFCPAWVEHPLGILDGRTPAQVAQLPEEQFKLVAAIEMFHGLIASSATQVMIQTRLRSLLNLPEPQPIMLPKESPDAFLDAFSVVPYWRWERVDLSGLNIDAYVALFQLGLFRNQQDVVTVVANNILALPVEKDQEQIHIAALEYLTNMCVTQGQSDKAAQYIKQGKELAENARLSDGLWNVYEFVLAIFEQKSEAQLILQHILQEHRNEEKVMASLREYMTQLGLLAPQPGMQTAQANTPQPMSQPQPAPEAAPQSQGLWTPGSDNKPAGSGGESKLWVPGS